MFSPALRGGCTKPEVRSAGEARAPACRSPGQRSWRGLRKPTFHPERVFFTAGLQEGPGSAARGRTWARVERRDDAGSLTWGEDGPLSSSVRARFGDAVVTTTST